MNANHRSAELPPFLKEVLAVLVENVDDMGTVEGSLEDLARQVSKKGDVHEALLKLRDRGHIKIKGIGEWLEIDIP